MTFVDAHPYILAAFYTLVALFYVLRVKLRQPVAPSCDFLHPGHRGSLHWWNHLTFRVFRIIIWAVCVARCVWPFMDQWLLFWPIAATPVLAIVGIVMLVVGFGLAVWGNLVLNGHWRSGIDEAGPSQLLTTSLYKFSRNPIFIGVMIAQTGFVLALPGPFSLLCWLVGVGAVHLQTHMEEQHLKQVLPHIYADYMRQTPRWIFRRSPPPGP